MSTFSCPVVRVAEVTEHPNADRLSIVKLEGLGYTCISAKLDDGRPRYKAGDLVVYIPSAAVLPEWLLRVMGFWNDELGKGALAGSSGDRVKPLKLRGIFSEGVLYPVLSHVAGYVIEIFGQGDEFVETGDDVSNLLGIEKWSPPIPVHMAGEVANMVDHTVKYDFERLESVPDMFGPGETVLATEKLHGTFCAIGYVPDLNHHEMFGEAGNIIVHSKGLGAQGLAFKNNAANDGNLYVRVLRRLLFDGLEEKLRDASALFGNKPVFIMGEIFGKGVQDLHYGTKDPEFRIFEIKAGDEYLPRDPFGFGYLDHQTKHGGTLGLDAVPILYHGPFDVAELEKVRDGKTLVGGENIREGIVIRSSPEGYHAVHGRKVAKMISPDYLLRKSKDATEFT